ncbi:phage virion morphogenesis protein [Gallaecimonas kandeliae]|uniref:phage virion morphogenesis protein n=1 Tax=Gallaecimonas kandeliae TaxID=3029055 RepID=UPI00264A2E21|nr:phage virion morphogenesis protein [Gallaecimonas kandeliae]WKE64343.1 phage virion morphogenesis protein [Gallaecimonas kandeliae]
MAGTQINIAPQGFAETHKTLQDLIDQGEDLQQPMAAIGEYLLGSTQDRFDAGVAPDGTPWAPLRPSTLARKTKNLDKVLIENGYLYNLVYQATSHDLSLGTPMVYGAMMQFGGTRAQFPHLWGDIPARPFLGVTPEDEAEILAIVADFLSGAVSA